jgi:nitrite reductase/ring-hydroxylating ferredoxin subunit
MTIEGSVEQTAPADVPIYAICSAADIAVGGARPFDLARVDEAGESRPFRVFVVRKEQDEYFAYANACPHEGTWLNVGAGEFFDPNRAFLKCGRHGAKFEIETGLCVEGPCKGAHLEPIALAVIDGDVCLCGVPLVEDDGFPNPFDELDDTMEIMIHPD